MHIYNTNKVNISTHISILPSTDLSYRILQLNSPLSYRNLLSNSATSPQWPVAAQKMPLLYTQDPASKIPETCTWKNRYKHKYNIYPGSPKTKLCPLVGSGILYMDHPKNHSLFGLGLPGYIYIFQFYYFDILIYLHLATATSAVA